MHRVITNCQPGLEVDHINHNRSDNRKENLRICTKKENLQNQKKYTNKPTTSIYKGVSWLKHRKRWQASIRCNSTCYYLGIFIDEQMAALAYNDKAIELFGDFANINNLNLSKEELVKLRKRMNDILYKNNTSSKYRGVSRQNNKWECRIYKDKIKYHLGYFESEIEAAAAYNIKSLKLYGKNGYQNTIKEGGEY